MEYSPTELLLPINVLQHTMLISQIRKVQFDYVIMMTKNFYPVKISLTIAKK